MAHKRMFSLDIVDSDAFLDMPSSTQNLYFHLGMRADDDGFIDNAKKIIKIVGASNDDLKLLIMKNFIIYFDTNIYLIKHWKINNYIPKDRYTETKYLEEKSKIYLKENNAYTLDKLKMNTECIQTVYRLDTQNRIEENRKEKNSKEEQKDLFFSFKSDYFEKIYNYYPKHKNKELAFTEFLKKVNFNTEKEIKIVCDKIGFLIKNNIVDKEDFDTKYCQDLNKWLADNIPDSKANNEEV